MRKHKLWLAALLAFSVTTILSAHKIAYAEAPGEIEAVYWMLMDKSSRDQYVSGYMAGMIWVLQVVNMDIRSGIDREISTEELSQLVYQKLLNEPELRRGPIGAIIVNAVAPYIQITDMRGMPLDIKSNKY